MPSRRLVVDPQGVAPPAAHYSHAVIGSGPFLFVAGQVPVDEEGEVVGRGDPEAQARQVLTNLGRVVESAGGRLEDTVRTTVYLTDLDHRAPVGGVRRQFFPGPPPANTLLVVSSLAHPDYLVEIDAIVALDG